LAHFECPSPGSLLRPVTEDFGDAHFSRWWPVLRCIVLFEDFGAAVRPVSFGIMRCYRIR
jgi:hypothetical protein